jgi:hypothetical protein
LDISPYKIPGDDIDAIDIVFSVSLGGTGFIAIVDRLKELSRSREMYFALKQAPDFVDATDAYLASAQPEIKPRPPATAAAVELSLTGISFLQVSFNSLITHSFFGPPGSDVVDSTCS